MEWKFDDSAFGKFGLQDMFYFGEQNGISVGQTGAKLSLDPLTGETVGGFFLIPKGAEIQFIDLEFVSNTIYNVKPNK